MKTFKQTIKKHIILSLVVMYQIVGLIHMAHLPLHTYADREHQSSSIDFYHKNRSTSIPRVAFQRSFHAFNDNGRKNLINPARIFLLFFAFVLTGIITLLKAKKAAGYLNDARIYTPYTYLSLRTLRI